VQGAFQSRLLSPLCSVDDFFDCLNGTASGHLAQSVHNEGRRSVTWGPHSEPSRADGFKSRHSGEDAQGSKHSNMRAGPSQNGVNQSGLRQTGSGRAQETPLGRRGSADSKAGLVAEQDVESAGMAEYSARAKIAGVKVFLLMPGEKRKGGLSSDRGKKAEPRRGHETGSSELGGEVISSRSHPEEMQPSRGVADTDLEQQQERTYRATGKVEETAGHVSEAQWRFAAEGTTKREEAVVVDLDGVLSEQSRWTTEQGGSGLFSARQNLERQNVESAVECIDAVSKGIGQSAPEEEGMWPSLDGEEAASHSADRFPAFLAAEGVDCFETSRDCPDGEAAQEEDTFSDALDFEDADSLELLGGSDGGMRKTACSKGFESSARRPGADGDVSDEESGSREEFGSANDVLKLDALAGSAGRAEEERPCEIVEREWSPEPEEREALEKRGAPFGAENWGAFGVSHAGEVALEMPLEEDESEGEEGYPMGQADPRAGSVFGRESLLAWSGAGSEHWNEEETGQGFGVSVSGGLGDRSLGEAPGGFQAEGLGFRSPEREDDERAEALGGGGKEVEGALNGRESDTLDREEEGEVEDGSDPAPRDFVEIVCTSLTLSVAISSSSTLIEVASDTVEIAEVLYNPAESQLSSPQPHSSQTPSGNRLGSFEGEPPIRTAQTVSPHESQLQQVEAALPSPFGFPHPSPPSQKPLPVPSHNSPNLPSSSKTTPLEVAHLFERRKLVKVRSGPPITKPAAVFKIVLGSVGSPGRIPGANFAPDGTQGRSLGRQGSLLGHVELSPPESPLRDINVELQPVTVYVDMGLPDRLKRFTNVVGGSPSLEPAVQPVPLLRASQVLPSPWRSFDGFLPAQVLPRPGSSPVDDIIDDLDMQLSRGGARNGGKAPAVDKQAGALSLSVSSPCFRAILSFPDLRNCSRSDGADFEGKSSEQAEHPGVGRGDFLALDLFSVKSHDDQDATLSFKSTPSRTTPQHSFPSSSAQDLGSCVSVGAGNLALYLVTDACSLEGDSATPPKYRAFSLLSVSSQPLVSRQPQKQKGPSKRARFSTCLEGGGAESEGLRGLGVSLEVRMKLEAETGDWLARLAWEGAAAQKTRGDGEATSRPLRLCSFYELFLQNS
jgi:hypothetical protein